MLSEIYQNHIYYKTKTIDKQFIKTGELLVKVEYISIMKTNTYWYWKQLENKESVIIETCTIVRPFLYVSNTKDIADITRSLWHKKQAQKAVQRLQICIPDSYHGYTLYETERRDQIYTKRNLCNVE